jgi:WD40 repeat protein
VDGQEPYELDVHEIGEGMRSVRFAALGDRKVLLLGVKRGCILYDLDDRQKRLYPLPDIKQPRGGVNAVAVHGTQLYATHSEYGLAQWDLNQPGRPAELLHDSITSVQKTTRAVQNAGDRLLFASGSDLYSVLFAEPSAAPVVYRGAHGPITSIARLGETIFASTEDGVILQWDIRQPEYPSVLLRKNDPIYGLRLAKLRGVAHLLYSFNDTSVHARVLGQTLEVEFEALGATFTLFDVVSDLLVSCGQRGRTLFLWKPSNPRRPTKTIDLSKIEPKEVMDLCIRRAPRVG